MDTIPMAKSKPFTMVDIIDYESHSVIRKTILKKITGTVIIMSFEKGEGLAENTSRFDKLDQIIEGNAEIQIDGEPFQLATGEAIIIPANKSVIIRAADRFKMIQTLIKSGYE